jgi:hypothetical protein
MPKEFVEAADESTEEEEKVTVYFEALGKNITDPSEPRHVLISWETPEDTAAPWKFIQLDQNKNYNGITGHPRNGKPADKNDIVEMGSMTQDDLDTINGIAEKAEKSGGNRAWMMAVLIQSALTLKDKNIITIDLLNSINDVAMFRGYEAALAASGLVGAEA